MSSTNRGNTRNKFDFYVTPVEHIRKFLKAFDRNHPGKLSNMNYILDPCAGGNEEYDMPYPKVLREFTNAEILTIDIRLDSKARFKGDYLSFVISDYADLIISNPPFNLAMEFIKKAFEDVKIKGFIIFFLRFSFLASDKRLSFFDDFMPDEIYLHHNRPSFFPEDFYNEDTGKTIKAGATDSCEYAHFVWDLNQPNAPFSKTYLI